MRQIMLALLSLSIVACEGQQKDQKKDSREAVKSEIDSPEATWKVQKQYDEQGNLVQYDSVYSWSYSNVRGDSLKVNLDSIMDHFQGFFEADSLPSWRGRFMYFPEADSLFMRDFFEDDYFLKNWEEQRLHMEGLMHSMDSSRNAFLKQFYPGLKESGKPQE